MTGPIAASGGMQYTCEICDVIFTAKPSSRRRFCSNACKGVWMSQDRSGKNRLPRIQLICDYCGLGLERIISGINNRNYCSASCRIAHVRGANHHGYKQVSLECEQCGKAFSVKPSYAKRTNIRFCSIQCKAAWQADNLGGRNSPFWSRVLRICRVCGGEFTATPYKTTNGGGLYCSFKCRVQWQRASGANTSNWQGGKSFEPYPATFNETFKQKIRERDGNICAICAGWGIDVHHINYIKEDTFAKNCITLCDVCHGKTGTNRDQWEARLAPLAIAREEGCEQSAQASA